MCVCVYRMRDYELGVKAHSILFRGRSKMHVITVGERRGREEADPHESVWPLALRLKCLITISFLFLPFILAQYFMESPILWYLK